MNEKLISALEGAQAIRQKTPKRPARPLKYERIVSVRLLRLCGRHWRTVDKLSGPSGGGRPRSHRPMADVLDRAPLIGRSRSTSYRSNVLDQPTRDRSVRTSRSTPQPSARNALRTATTPSSLKFQQLHPLSSTSLCSVASRKLLRAFLLWKCQCCT